MDDDASRGRAGGKARAKKLPPERLKEIARQGALARWRNKPLKAIHEGNFQKEFGIDVKCYVLDDEIKTAVISQTGMARTLGLSARGIAFPKFIRSQAMAQFVGAELREKIENPVRFQWGTGGAELPPSIFHGFNATLLIDVCNAIIKAEAAGALKATRYKKIVAQAHIVVGASAKSGITRLVYDLAGYHPSTEEVIAAFKLYIQEEARKYEPEFPNELYINWHRLYDIPIPERGKPWQFKYLTIRHIYYPLAKSSGKILNLLRALKAKDGDRQKKLFQFLNEVGARALRMHLGRVLEMAESSKDRHDYEMKIAHRFGGQLEFELIAPSEPTS